MAQPSQINALRATDFPKGIPDKATADKLFQILNPFLQNVGQTTTAGTALQTNIDGQFAQAKIAASSAWLPMTLTSPFTGNPFTPWPQPGYRVDGTGRLWCRGLFTAASAPTITNTFWTYPNPLLAPSETTGVGTGRMFAIPFTTDTAGRGFLQRLDAGTDSLKWADNQGPAFGTGGETAGANSSLTTNLLGNVTYRMDGNGRVFLSGNIGTSTGGFTTGFTITTLPAGFRPAVTETFGTTIQSSGAVFSPALITIDTGGVMKVFWSTGAMQVGALGISGFNFMTSALPAATPSAIYYGSLDMITWDTKGGPMMSTRTGFPLQIRLKDGKKPLFVVCWAVNDKTNATETVANPSWTYNGDGQTGNMLTVNAVNDLREGEPYTLNFFIFY